MTLESVAAHDLVSPRPAQLGHVVRRARLGNQEPGFVSSDIHEHVRRVSENQKTSKHIHVLRAAGPSMQEAPTKTSQTASNLEDKFRPPDLYQNTRLFSTNVKARTQL